MKQIISPAILLFLFCFMLVGISRSRAQGWQWAAKGTCTACAIEMGSVGVDRHGNVYEAGTAIMSTPDHLISSFGSLSVTNIGDQPFQGILVSTDQSGNYRWATGSQGNIVIFSEIAVDPRGDIYVMGNCEYPIGGSFTFGGKSFTGLYFVAKVNSLGSVEWIKDVAPGAMQVNGIAVNANGNFFTTGMFKGHSIAIGSNTLTNADVTGTTPDVFVAMYDTAGNALWAKSLGGSDSENVGAIAVTGNNEVYVAGIYNSATMTVGSSTLTSAGSGPFYVAKFSSAGTPLWARTDLRDTSVFIYSLATDKQGSVYLTGEQLSFNPVYYYFGADSISCVNPFFLARYDSSGNPKWIRTVNSSFTAGYDVVADACGNIWTCGSSTDSDPTHDPMFLAEFDTTGHLEDTLTLISGGDDTPPYAGAFGQWLGVTIDNQGNLFVASDYAVTPFQVGSTTLIIPDTFSEPSFLLKYKYATSFCIPDTVAEAQQVTLTPALWLFPNPAHTQLTIRSNGQPINEVVITNLLGQTVAAPDLPKGEEVLRIDVGNLPRGIYLVRINGSEVRKFVKQ